MTVHIIGAGLAGLACAMALTQSGKQLVIYEMSRNAGGRCRSFYDSNIERHIDNGTHLILSANTRAVQWIKSLNCHDSYTVIAPAVFPFLDLTNGEQWTLQPNGGRLPWWLMCSERRVPGSRLSDYLSVYRLWEWGARSSRGGLTVADSLTGPLMRRLWQPLTEATLNTEPEVASAALFARVIEKSFLRGERACRPYLARHGLGAALIEPAICRMMKAGAVVRFGSRLRTVSVIGQTLQLFFDTGIVETKKGDSVVLALPPWSLAKIWPGLKVPKKFRAIINVHYLLKRPVQLPGGGVFLAVIGGLAQWLFVRGDVLSVTISAANTLATQSNAVIARHVWADCAAILKICMKKIPPSRVIKEKRATLAHTPDEDNRTVPLPPLPSLVFAGDWTCHNLPNTIESAITSGVRAAAHVLGQISDAQYQG